MKAKTKKTLLIVLGGVAAIVVIVYSLKVSGGPPSTEVQVDLVKIGDVSEKVSATGRIQPQTKVDITSQVSAEIVGLYVNEGDRVNKGDLLIQLDRVQLSSDVQQMQYSLDDITARAEAARVRRDQDKEEYERQKKLFERNLTSETDFTNAKYAAENSAANYTSLLSQVKTQKARLEKAKDSLDKTKIVSPMDGVVTFLNAEVGEIAQAQTSFTQGKTLMTISDLSVFEVEVDVDETEIAKIDIGQPSDIEVDAFADSVFKGHVVEIGNSAILQGQGTQEFSINFRVKVRFEPTTARIRPGMSASVDITTSTAHNTPLVPYAAIVMRELPEDSLEKSASSKDDSSDGVFVSDANAAEVDDSDLNTNASDGADNTASDKTDADKTDAGATAADKSTVKGEKKKRTGVFVLRDGEAHFVAVKTGIADEKNIVALSGLQEGDTVISGSFKTLRELEEGDAVKISQRSLDKLSGKKSKFRRGGRNRKDGK